jgi:serine protease inhibitor
MNEGYSKVSRQSPVSRSSNVNEQMQGDQSSSAKNIEIPAGIFDPNYGYQSDSNQHIYDDEYPKLKNKPDEFDWKLVQSTLAASNDENVVLSPISVKILMTLLAEGAGDAVESDTYKQLKQVLPDDKTLTKAKAYYTKFFESLDAEGVKNGEYFILNMETKIFVDKIVNPNQKYQAIAEADYRTEMERVDFNSVDNTVKLINKWVADKTNNRIKDLVTPSAVAHSVILMLNAIYFQGLWRSGFLEKNTSNLDFHISPKEKIKVPFMFQNGEFFYGYSKELEARIIRLPYRGDRYSMFIILPNAIGGIENVLVNMDAEKINKAAWEMDRSDVSLFMPKFKFDTSSKFNDVLKTLGITEVFSDFASLPAIARGGESENKLKVSNVIQKAGIVVDEKGTEAYAATQVELVNKFGGDPKSVVVDRPFVFYIEDELTGQKLFAGRVSRPKY